MQDNNLFDKIENYFRQQEELSGGELYLEKNILQENNNIKKTNLKKKVILNNESDLFTEKPSWMNCGSLNELNNEIKDCRNCKLGSTRTNFVFGVGNPQADVMIIGEAPGRDEDLQGEPFVGRAGQLLTKILEAINLSRDGVYIANIIKCRPPDNRRPEAVEVEQCEPYLQKQIELISPEFILALGLTAVDTLLKKRHVMKETRGKVLDYHGIKTLVTYHPAALLRNPHWKKNTWEDVKLLRNMLDNFLKNK